MKKVITALALTAITFSGFAQQDDSSSKSNIQTYTPSKLLKKGQWDIKWFNNLYTQTAAANADGDITRNLDRENFFTTSFDIFTGISENNSINVGLLFDIRSNTTRGDRSAFDVFQFDQDDTSARSGFTSIAPVIKFNPISSVSNFTVQTALHIPLIGEESNANNIFLDQTALTFQNRFFYDYTFTGDQWQIFGEINTEYNFGEEESFANKTFSVAPGAFLSYFPSSETTVLGFIQHFHRFGDFEQDFSAVGLGAKYQLNKILNLEAIYSRFVRGNDTGIGQSFNLGLRALF